MVKKRISRGKFNKLQKLSNDHGIIAALAIDQRGSMKKMMEAAAQQAGKKYNIEMVYEFKELVSQVLTNHVSGILLDEELGFKGIKSKAKQTGLILSYEKTGYDVKTVGRFPELLPNESLHRLLNKGADAAKVLVYYNPNDKAEINDVKHAFLERLGAEGLAADIPLFVEIVTYDDAIPDTKSVAFAKEKPQLVIDSMREFSKEKYHIDVIKTEVPVNFDYVEGYTADGVAPLYTKEEAAKYFASANKAVDRPFIYLSAGVSAETFRNELTFAGESHTKYNGILGGRATWLQGVQVYAQKGRDGLIEWLNTQGKQNITELNDILNEGATPWYDWYGGLDNIEVFDKDIMK
ncbi:tagatose 1,6-diphosphate aldolase [Liquorilactobacillus mali]|uniref:Tagatose 1,6-diphosphate aldolase n=1 Tax=Liquorilactobacillus mali KCTC 3596 = DSM 20444 TaxID=1046596 RepID=J1F5I3_9LACO|nr:tagatose 1,6-diphosphate aldolase [Liquorilactobacillus mali]EJF01631.1 tagatose 1,6-diphosphate aldolase [Liquorilactobacillus mali KCTC 3596 = DSM 20444]KRN09100.1 tagatose 1,6-diphosphate aldolase [Liquorilactobacillus mali KCTC 3596 = DSM 20444]QFQ74406.1 tagatose 1,6-diphosphate aldolase [Liquorilactobacillus mali]